MKEKKERNPEAEAVGKRVKCARLGRGMTQESLAEAAETSTQFLSQIEKGEQSMTMPKFAKLVKALDVSADYLLFGREPVQDTAALAAEFLGGMTPIERDILARVIIGLEGILDAIKPEQ